MQNFFRKNMRKQILQIDLKNLNEESKDFIESNEDLVKDSLKEKISIEKRIRENSFNFNLNKSYNSNDILKAKNLSKSYPKNKENIGTKNNEDDLGLKDLFKQRQN